MIREPNYQKYTGAALQEYNAMHDLDPYFPSEDLIRAVEVARLLERPLLLRGEPGSGKTRLAEALAFEIHGDDWKDHYFRWNIKSSTKAEEGLYRFDHLARLRDVQDTGTKKEPKGKYVEKGALGKAFEACKKGVSPAVLLIDEIDKADIDFPNDLLDVLEGRPKQFEIRETGEVVKAEQSPIVIISSNDEKELPNAFLRRCVFHFIPFPDYDDLLKIAQANLDKQPESGLDQEWLRKTVRKFLDIHREMKKNPNTDKPVSTSELLDWLRVITFYQPQEKGEITVGEQGQLIFADGRVLYPEVLFKSYDDLQSQLGKENV